MMRFQIFILTTIFAFALILTACPSGTPSNTNAPANAPNANAPTNGGNTGSNEFKPTVRTPDATTNEALTLKPTFLAYCDAMTKKDEAAIRKVYSQATLKQFEADMKAEGTKSLVEYLSVDQVSNKLCEIRNEKVEGDTAVAEVRTEGTPNGFKVKFVKENGEWKLTNESPEIESVKKTASNTNTAK